MKKIGLKIVGIIVIAIIALQFNVVLAATSSELNASKTETDKKIEEAKEELENINSEKSETLQQVEDLIMQISSAQSEIDELDSKIADMNTQIEEAQSKLNEKQEEYDDKEALLEKRLVTAYEAGETSYLDVLLSSSSLTDLISNYYMISEITQSDMELMDKIKKEKEEIETAKQTLEISKQELDSAKAEKQQKATELQNTKSQKDSYVAQLNEQEKNTQAELEQFEQDKRDIQAQLAEIARKETANSGSSNVSNIPNNPSASGYIRPVVGYSITTGWMGYSGHTGVDFSGSGISGKPVLAVKAGTVVTSTALKYSNGNYRSYGEYIVINHHDGTMTLYAHGAPGSRLVSAGQSVSQGQQIMSVGTTGNSTGYHLHFEVRINGTPVNPTPYLP